MHSDTCHWRVTEGQEPIDSCTIITCDANSMVANIHDRMPVILQPKAYDVRMDLHNARTAALIELMKPYPDSLMEIWPAGLRVNSPRNDSAVLIEPA